MSAYHNEGLLVWCIWRVEISNRANRISGMSTARMSNLRKVMQIIVESGLLYTVTAFISFITFVTGNNGVYVITDAVRVSLLFFSREDLTCLRSRRHKSLESRSTSSRYGHPGLQRATRSNTTAKKSRLEVRLCTSSHLGLSPTPPRLPLSIDPQRCTLL